MLKINLSLPEKSGASELSMSFLPQLFYSVLAALKQSKRHASCFQPSLISQAQIRSCIVLVSEHLTEVNDYISYIFVGWIYTLVIKAWLCTWRSPMCSSAVWCLEYRARLWSQGWLHGAFCQPLLSWYRSALQSAVFFMPSPSTCAKQYHSPT